MLSFAQQIYIFFPHQHHPTFPKNSFSVCVSEVRQDITSLLQLERVSEFNWSTKCLTEYLRDIATTQGPYFSHWLLLEFSLERDFDPHLQRFCFFPFLLKHPEAG